MKPVIDQAVQEAELFAQMGVDALIIENFRDIPFYPDRVPHETVAAMSTIAREVVNRVDVPIGINVLRNDADAALSIAAAVGAQFIRINVHNGAVLADQGVIQGKAYETLRKRKALNAQVMILADVAVKHAAPLANLSLEVEARDLSERSLADALIVSGTGTGAETNFNDLKAVKDNTHLPVLIGSGVTPSNMRTLNSMADGFIVGSYFKKDGKVTNEVDPTRVQEFVDIYRVIR